MTEPKDWLEELAKQIVAELLDRRMLYDREGMDDDGSTVALPELAVKIISRRLRNANLLREEESGL